MLRLISIFFLFNICSILSANSLDIIVKANIICGSGFDTSEFNVEEMEASIKFHTKHLKINTTEINRLYVDMFVYQFRVDVPMVTTVVRSAKGIHYYDLDGSIFYRASEEKIWRFVKILTSRIPKIIDSSKNYELTTKDLIKPTRNLGIKRVLNQSMISDYRDNYSCYKNWGSNEPLKFIVSDFESYLSFCLDNKLIRANLESQQSMKLFVNIDSNGKSYLENIHCPFELNEEDKLTFQKAFDAIPLWITDDGLKNMEIIIESNF